MSPEQRAELEAELAQVDAKIDAAYWAFTRQARAKPPVLAVPAAYQRRSELHRLLGLDWTRRVT